MSKTKQNFLWELKDRIKSPCDYSTIHYLLIECEQEIERLNNELDKKNEELKLLLIENCRLEDSLYKV